MQQHVSSRKPVLIQTLLRHDLVVIGEFGYLAAASTARSVATGQYNPQSPIIATLPLAFRMWLVPTRKTYYPACGGL